MNGGFPANYYLCTIHSRMYIYNSLVLPFYASHFIYVYRVFACKSIVVIIIFMYVSFIFPNINCCNHTMTLFIHSVVVDYYIQFLFLLISLASDRCNPTKPANRGSTYGVPITVTNPITAKKPSQPPLWPTSLMTSSPSDTLPQIHSWHQESGTWRNCYSWWLLI